MGENCEKGQPWKYYHKHSIWSKDSRVNKSKKNTVEFPELFFEKRYPRFERLTFSSTSSGLTNEKLRHSTRSFEPNIKITEPEIYGLIEPLFPIHSHDESHLLYSSAGGFYAVETYLYSNNVQGLEDNCLYHVLKKEHSIEKLWPKPNFLQSTFEDQTWVHDCALLVILTLNMTPYQNKYGNRGYRFGLIEVGSIIQLLTTSPGGIIFPSCVLGGYNDHEIMDALDLSIDCDEQPACCIAFGGII